MRRVWSNRPESAASQVLMSLLSLRGHERWSRVEAPQEASILLVDDAFPFDRDGLIHLHSRNPDVPVGFVSDSLMALPSPGMTFFKRPVQASVLQRWLDARLSTPAGGQSAAPAVLPGGDWRQGLIRLTHWPNITAYGGSMALTLACAQLLQAPHRYSAVLDWGVEQEAFDRLLQDAQVAGILLVEDPHAHHAPAEDAVPAKPAPTSLIGRLLRRFGR